jgi:hypothetical protein
MRRIGRDELPPEPLVSVFPLSRVNILRLPDVAVPPTLLRDHCGTLAVPILFLASFSLAAAAAAATPAADADPVAVVEYFHAAFDTARRRREELRGDPAEVERILADGAQRAREIAGPIMTQVRAATGIR